jgi:GTPase Era involved in 16S rRNA processing
MSKITGHYEELRDSFLAVFDTLVSEKFVVAEDKKTDYTPADIAGFKNDLAEGKFIVSVCGQMNAGKSTLLNHLIFDDEEILPAAATPWTAKLTEIGFGEKDRALIVFYSQTQWDALKKLEVPDSENPDTMIRYFDKYLEPELKRLAAEGIFAEEFIKREARVMELDDLKQLRPYLTSKGVYTPFVSHVKILTNKPIVRDLIIVDTPGLNDPNELRSRLTTEFIIQSSAVVYLFFSTSPLTSADLDFIDRHLFSIPSSKIVFGMSRSDLIKDINGIRQYIEENLKTVPELKDRNLLVDSQVFPFSTMAAVIKKKEDKNIPLTENERFFMRKMSRTLIESGGLMDKFLLGIERNLMDDKAGAILDVAYSRIKAVCLARINRLSADLGFAEQKIEDQTLSIGELEEKIKKVKSISSLINDAIDAFEEKKNEVLTGISERILANRQAIITDARSGYSSWIESVKVPEALKLSAFEINRILVEQATTHMDSALAGTSFSDLEDFQTNLKNKIKAATTEIMPLRRWAFVFRPIIPVRAIIDEALRSLKNIAPELEKLRVAFLDLFTQKEATRANLKGKVFEIIDTVVREFCILLNSKVNQQLDDFFNELKKEIRDYLNRYTDELTQLKADSTDKSGQLDKARAQLEQTKAELEKYSRSFESIESSAGAQWRAYTSKRSNHE